MQMLYLSYFRPLPKPPHEAISMTGIKIRPDRNTAAQTAQNATNVAAEDEYTEAN